MKKVTKIVLSAVAIIITLIVIAVGVYKILDHYNSSVDSPEQVNDNDTSQTVSGNNKTDSNNSTDNTNNREAYDRTPIWDDYRNRDYVKGVTNGVLVGDSNTTSEEDKNLSIAQSLASLLVEYPDACVKYYDFSHGFVTLPTSNIYPMSTPFTSTMCSTVDGSVITIEESDPSVNTGKSMRDLHLESLGFYRHVGFDCKGIDDSAEVIEGKGLSNYRDYYLNGVPNEDPTILKSYQLLAESEMDSTLGKVYYTIIFRSDIKSYIGYADIDCNNGRVLSIKIDSDNKDYIIPYIKETLESSVLLIE